MAKRVLLLEDDANLGSILQEHLQLNGFEVKLCVDGEEGIAEFNRESFDICLVDVMMPRKDGFTFAKEVRSSQRDIPLIFLTAKSLKEDKIHGFKIGCDDYITKPFSVEELLLRIKAVLKRSGTADSDQTIFSIGEYRFDSNLQSLTKGDNKYDLTAKESELLKLLCLNVNRTLKREDALKKIWNDDSYFSGRSMDVFISRLRKYLQHDNSISILSIRSVGFRLTVGK